MAGDRDRGVDRPGPGGRDGRRFGEQMRRALAEIEEQRDDAVVYLSAIRAVLDVIARGHGTRQCGQEIAVALVHQLVLETCAVAVEDRAAGTLELAGFATQAQRLGGRPSGLGEAGWIALARLVGPGVEPTCFRRLPDGGFGAVAATELDGEGFLVLPFTAGGETGGAVILHSLVAPAQAFARSRALGLVAEIVGQALSIARMRDSLERLCGELEGELGMTRRALSAREESLRSQAENIESLTQALIRSNRVKREFLATVSHELRTPLNAILGYSALVRDGIAGPLTAEQTGLLDRVLGNTRNLNALIDDILFFVQLEADRVLVRREPTATVEVIEEAVASIPEPVRQRQVALRVVIAPEAAVLNVDAALLRRVLFHLLGNALKFTAHGEVSVDVRPADDRERAVIVVRDTGIGIAPERVGELFELFSQGDGSSTRRYSGLGMGLTLVQRCVHLLGGEISVESRPDAGSEFRVSLPGALGGLACEPSGAADATVH
jgi:signal transduction histidine kinase